MHKKASRFCAYFALAIITIVSLFPWILMLRIAFIEPQKYFEMPVDWFAAPTFQHFVKVLSGPFPKYLLNSLILGLMSTLLVMLVGTFAAFALAKYKLQKKDNLLFFVLSTRMGPPVVFAVPLYLLMVRFSLIDKHAGMLLLYTFYNLAFAIWMMYGFFKDTPVEVEEAAMLDGLSDFGVFSRISLPMVTPGPVSYTHLDVYKRQPLQWIYMEGLAINSSSKNKEAAWLFLQWRMSRETTMKELTELARTDTPNLYVLNSDEYRQFAEERNMTAYTEILPESWKLADIRYWPFIPEFVEIGDAFMVEISAALAGQQDVPTALDKAQKAIDQILREANYY